MAICVAFDRAERFEEIPGCPLARAGDPRDEQACAGCRFNVLHPGAPGPGCHLHVSRAGHDAALAHLAAAAPDGHKKLLAVVEAHRGGAVEDPAELRTVREVAARWAGILATPEEHDIVVALTRFSEAALLQREPVRVLS